MLQAALKQEICICVNFSLPLVKNNAKKCQKACNMDNSGRKDQNLHQTLYVSTQLFEEVRFGQNSCVMDGIPWSIT